MKTTGMKKIGMLKAIMESRAFSKADPAGRAALQERRLKDMIAWARAESPFYRKLYKDLPADCSLLDLPVVEKQTLMANWDNWITDSDTGLTEVNTFMENPDNAGRKLKGKYLVFTTSGSTGNPLVALCDSTTNNVMGAINLLRSFARKEDLLAFMKRGGKTIGVFATGGFYLGNGFPTLSTVMCRPPTPVPKAAPSRANAGNSTSTSTTTGLSLSPWTQTTIRSRMARNPTKYC
jgi:phenylacetate-coenzyme A ligase PaaK-like adenylate-forming protein